MFCCNIGGTDVKTALIMEGGAMRGMIGHTEKDPNELERVYQIGIHEAENRLEDIRSFLAGGEGQ